MLHRLPGMRIHAFNTKNTIIAAASQKIENPCKASAYPGSFFGSTPTCIAHCKLVHTPSILMLYKSSRTLNTKPTTKAIPTIKIAILSGKPV